MAHVLTNDLREAVLQAAITGKLTEHLERDADVIELLKKCKKDKETAIKDGKFRKEPFRSPLVNDEFPDIPEYWAWSYISDISLFQEGPGILAADFCSNGIPLIRISGLQTEEVKLTGCNYLDPEKVERKWKHYKLDKGDIVLSTSASMDKVCEVYDEAIGAIPYTGQIRFKMYGGILKDYFKIFVKSPFYKKQISEQEAGGMIKHYGPTHLRKMVISIPPIEEQARIVAKVDKIMAKIDEYEKLENQLVKLKEQFPQDMKDSLLQAGMTGKLTEHLETDTPVEDTIQTLKQTKTILTKEGKIKKEKPLPDINEEEIMYDIPKYWKWIRFGEVVDCAAGSTPLKSNAQYYDGGTIKWLLTGDLNDGYIYDCKSRITELALEKCSFRINHKNDILIAMYGATIGKLGICKDDFVTNQACLGCTPFDGLYYMYLFYLLKAEKDNLIGKAEGGAQPNISRVKIRNHIIPFPPIEEQQRIVDKLDELLPLVDKLAELN